MTGKPKPDSGIGAAETGGAILAVGSEEAQNPKGIYDSRGQRSDLEAVYGENNVTSTTVPKKPQQASTNRADVSVDMNGNKAVELTLKDGTVKRIPYDSRGLAIFDDVVVFTTKIDTTKSYTGQMRQASLDMWKAIKDDPIAQSKFTSSQLDSLKRGKAKVEGYTWHHNAQSAPEPPRLYRRVDCLSQAALSDSLRLS
ncbi:HNH endonuclease [Psychrobacter phenylpyruvicus]|uniref:Uncharacterized protein n=1 Tax=Psychrobacter phenylpyruvicus TaxID=29432 RepID=A0A379LL36_9GAMM|nr:HNH endonuclease [Psychrobacter phenylpyruvicus]SUD90607.1 Uncharacterised protein [Psychrobacter phenylpyruvicus]